MRSSLLFGLLVAVAAATSCQKGWLTFIPTNSCFLYVRGDPVTQPQAQELCRAKGTNLAALNTKDELEFMQNYVNGIWDSTYNFGEQPWIGMRRQGKNNWIWEDGSKGRGVAWAKGEPNNLRGIENCVKWNIVCVFDENGKLVLFKNDTGTTNDTPCDRVSSRYICSEKLPVKCDVNARNTTIDCVCKPGYVDIRSTYLPDGQLYTKSGMKCIALNPCGAVVEPQTIIFIMDSSGSVGQTGWENLVAFIEKAAPLVPKNSRVGFIKYSSNVTAKLWLKDNWSEQDFLNAIPKDFDGASTATAIAITAAAELLEGDPNQKKTVILLTDGLPDYPVEAALEELKLTKAKLLAVGFGNGLGDYGRTAIESWLDNPSEDYFAYQEKTALFTADHMKGILTQVC